MTKLGFEVPSKTHNIFDLGSGVSCTGLIYFRIDQIWLSFFEVAPFGVVFHREARMKTGFFWAPLLVWDKPA